MSYSLHNKACQVLLVADAVGLLALIPLAFMVGFWFHAIVCAVMVVMCIFALIAVRKDKRS